MYEQAGADADRREQSGAPAALERDLRDQRRVGTRGDRQQRQDGEPGDEERIDRQ
jgi:hypothetical protein